jgi:hypothetical protein
MGPVRRKTPFVTPPPLTSNISADSQLPVQNFEREPEIEYALAGKDVGDAILAQSREVGVGDLFGQHDNDRIVADIGASPSDLSVRIEHESIRGRVRPGDPRLSRIALVRVIGIGVELGVFLTGDVAHEPGIAREPFMQALE